MQWQWRLLVVAPISVTSEDASGPKKEGKKKATEKKERKGGERVKKWKKGTGKMEAKREKYMNNRTKTNQCNRKERKHKNKRPNGDR